MEELLAYLTKQRNERAEVLYKYTIVKAAYDEAKAKLDAFGDISGVEAEIERLDGFIESVAGKIDAAEGGVDGVVTEAEA